MLIDFTVANYRSIKDPVTLSAVEAASARGKARGDGSKRTIKSDAEIAAPRPVEGRGIALLPVLGIFGANASGKSNVVRALNDLLCLMASPQADWGGLRRLIPFRLDAGSAQHSTKFELRVMAGDAIYTFNLEASPERVFGEKLTYLPLRARSDQLLYKRQWVENEGRYRWSNGKSFAGPHTQLQPGLKENQLFVTLMVKQVGVQIVNSFAGWVGDYWAGITLGEEDSDHQTASMVAHNNSHWRGRILDFIRGFDTGVSDMEVRQRDDQPGRLTHQYEVVVHHETAHGRVAWPLEEESTGTQRLFGIAPKVVYALGTGRLIVVDELGSNIHPRITRHMVRMFQEESTNPLRAQLIFTSHDNTLQRNQLLRRDQIWFTQKRRDGSTELYPLSDFRVRNDLAIDRAYLDGRFGAVPLLPDAEDAPVPAESAG